MFVASITRDPRAVLVVVRHVAIADWLFTSTTIVIQPLTGYLLARPLGLALSTSWIVWSIGLYLLAGACWLPVVWLQMRMRDMARAGVNTAASLPARYWRFLKLWVALGIPAFIALIVVFYLMVAKPA